MLTRDEDFPLNIPTIRIDKLIPYCLPAASKKRESVPVLEDEQ